MYKWMVVVALVWGSLSAFAAETVVAKPQHSAGRKQLIGNHKLALQWISWTHFGSATVVEEAGQLKLTGEQRAKEGQDFLTIEGTITDIRAKTFTFRGVIKTRVDTIYKSEVPCVREGEMTFRISGKRPYWRLKDMANPCVGGGLVDYVDLYFD